MSKHLQPFAPTEPASVQPSYSLLGQTVSHYRVIQKLGAGGMGVVYKALDTKLERTVALKFLPESVTVTGGDKTNLQREARAASNLDHPNIGVIHGLDESTDQHLFIVMQYYEGETLAQRISHGPLPLGETLDLGIQIAAGLAAAHARNIVHRDIKPSNVIITKAGLAKIVDFGLARMVASTSATQTMSATGTLPYMAPEQILGETVDQRADVWALAVMLVQMVTGTHPFLRPSTTAITFAILNQPPAGLDIVPDALRPVLYRALSKKPERRYAGAGEMLADLQAARATLLALPTQPAELTQSHSVTPRELKQFMQNASTPTWIGRESQTARWLAAGSLVLILAVAVAFILPPSRERIAGLAYASSEKHIAVLPFANGNAVADPEYQPVAEGLMDSMTNELSNLEAAQHSLWVVPASVVRGHNVSDPVSAFRDLGATLVVQGTVARKGSDVTMTVVLIDAKHLRQIGSVDFDNPAGDLEALQTQTVNQLAHLMKVSAVATVPSGGGAPGAYESYLKALGYLQRYDKPGNADLAITELQSALEKNPRFALGFATLGEAYRLRFLMDHNPGSVELAFANCHKALELDPNLPTVHVTLGHLEAALGKDDLALLEFQKVLTLNPRDADAIIGIAGVHEHAGHLSEAEAQFKRAIALRPDYWDGYRALAEFYDRQKRIQDSILQYRRIIELTPDNPEGYSDLGVEYMALGDSQSGSAAEAAFRKSLQLAPNYQAYANLGWLYLGQKRYDEAAAATRKALTLNDKDWRVWANLELAYTWLKDEPQIRFARRKTLPLLEQYAAVNPQDAPVQSMLSMLYAEEKRRDNALTHARSALALSPHDPGILADIAETYDDLGDRPRALQFIHQSLENGYTLNDLQQRPVLDGLLADPAFRSRGGQ